MTDYQEVVYTVGPDTIRQAVLAWLHDHHGAAFIERTAVKFCAGDSIAVTTRYETSEDDPPNDPR